MKARSSITPREKSPVRLLNQFSMDEQGEYFRVATTIGNVWGGSGETKSTNNVYVLDQNLDIFGRLENLAPGEQISLGAIHGQSLLPGDLQAGRPPLCH